LAGRLVSRLAKRRALLRAPAAARLAASRSSIPFIGQSRWGISAGVQQCPNYLPSFVS
jgi:hypothetical protein